MNTSQTIYHFAKRMALTLILTIATITINAQFLFRISGNGLKDPSYMLGTIHNLSGSLLDSIPEYLEAELQCQQMYVEHKPSTTTMVISLGEQGLQRVDYPDDKNIFDVIDKESAEILTEKFKEATNRDLSDSTWESLWKMTPSAFQNQLTWHLSGLQERKGSMDMDLMKKVQQRGWNVGQLDDERMTLNNLIGPQEKKPLTIEEQADSLMAFLKNYEVRKQQLFEEIEKTNNYWRTGDYEGFVSFRIQEINQMPELIKERNEKWLPRMIAAMHEKPTMFVFGAGHLIGEHGIIENLREAGYKVEQVQKNNT
jgi:hypothetical protein